VAFTYTTNKKYSACFSPNCKTDNERVVYWSKGMQRIYDNRYVVDIRRRYSYDDRHCGCRIRNRYADYVLVEDCRGRVYAVYYKDIDNITLHCKCSCRKDWDKYIYIFD